MFISPLKKAFASLVRAWVRFEENTMDLEVRDSCIQRFEYTFELSIKLMKRYIETMPVVTENVDYVNYRDLLRMAAEMGLIQEVQFWFEFREARNKTSHAYDEEIAETVLKIIPTFIKHSQDFIATLEDRLRASS
jgi:nucleotidyltransferase substrate binding protein (TIGR01987 family)